jgi:tryptophanyl-tRNA synthetase
LDVDVPWKWLNFFLEDDAELKTIGEEYGAGRMLTGQVKKRLIEVLPTWEEITPPPPSPPPSPS